jgi:hypothetical protein
VVFAAVTALFGAAVLYCGPGTSVVSAQAFPPGPRPFLDWIARGSTTLDNWYDPGTGLFRTTGWWNSALALEAELTASRLLGDDGGARRAVTTYAANQASGFLSTSVAGPSSSTTPYPSGLAIGDPVISSACAGAVPSTPVTPRARVRLWRVWMRRRSWPDFAGTEVPEPLVMTVFVDGV